MKAVAIDRFGGIETLETQELPIPVVGADEVLVHVEAAGGGVWDPLEREGGFAKEFNIKPVFPLVLGSDGAGTVEAVGPVLSFDRRCSMSTSTNGQGRERAGCSGPS